MNETDMKAKYPAGYGSPLNVPAGADWRERGRPTIAELEAILRQPNPPAVEITPAGEVVMKGLRHEIEQAVNRASAENGSGTPDYILAEYLVSCLAAFDRATLARDRHFATSVPA